MSRSGKNEVRESAETIGVKVKSGKKKRKKRGERGALLGAEYITRSRPPTEERILFSAIVSSATRRLIREDPRGAKNLDRASSELDRKSLQIVLI